MFLESVFQTVRRECFAHIYNIIVFIKKDVNARFFDIIF